MLSEELEELLRSTNSVIVNERNIYDGSDKFTIVKVEDGVHGSFVLKFEITDNDLVTRRVSLADILRSYANNDVFGDDNEGKGVEFTNYLMTRLHEDFAVHFTKTLDVQGPNGVVHLKKYRWKFPRYERDFRYIYEAFINDLKDRVDFPKYAYVYNRPDIPTLMYDYSDVAITMYIACECKEILNS